MAQPPDTLWTRTYLENQYERATGFAMTADGGYVMCGAISDQPEEYTRAFVRKVDGIGNEQWIQQLGSNTSVAIASDVLQASDQSIITVGANPSAEIYTSFFFRQNLNGDSLMSRILGGAAMCVEETADGGYLVAGEQRGVIGGIDAQVNKLAREGIPVWFRRYSRGPHYRLYVADVVVLKDNRFVLVTYSKRLFTTDPMTLYVICASETGDTLWTHEVVEENASLTATNACATNDDQIVISCDSDGDVFQVLLFWMNVEGDILRTRQYRDENGSADHVSVTQAYDGGLVCCGTRHDFPTRATLWRLDSLGNELWQTTTFNRNLVDFGGVRAFQNRFG
ncbi:MAG: hypothetical protein PHI18_07920, partial [bacterium]|nr:hypothetical protein [bacterium]